MRRGRLRFLVGGLVVALAILSLVLFAFRDSGIYYYNVSELQAKGPVEHVRLAGFVVAGSVRQGGEVTDPLEFQLRDVSQADKVISVSHIGTVPDTFKDDPNLEVVVEGDYSASGRFDSTLIMTKCSSKYQSEPTDSTVPSPSTTFGPAAGD